MMLRIKENLDLASLSLIHYISITLALVSAYIHLLLGYRIGLTSLGISFIAASIIFLIGIVLVLAGFHRSKVYITGAIFVIGQIILWIWMNSITLEMIPHGLGNLETVDKTTQIILSILLIYLWTIENNTKKNFNFVREL